MVETRRDGGARWPRRVAVALAAVAFNVACGVAALEWLAPLFMAPERVAFHHDVEHRLEPGGEPDRNSDGLRTRWEPWEFRPEETNVAFLGDSFVYGLLLEREQAIPQQFEQLASARRPEARVRVANFGWPSSSPLLSYRLLRDIGGDYAPGIVILAIDMTDFNDEIFYHHRLEGYGVYALADRIPITVHAMVKLGRATGAYPWLVGREFPKQRFFVTNQPLTASRPHLAYLEESLARLHRHVTHELGARLMVVVLPRAYQYDAGETPRNWEGHEYEPLGPHVHEPFRYFAELDARVPYPIHSLLADFERSPVFPTTFEADPHYNEAGAAIAAEAIYRLCEDFGCFGEPGAGADVAAR